MLDELYYLRDIAGERAQRIFELEAALARTGDDRERRIAELEALLARPGGPALKLTQMEAELGRARAELKRVVSSRSWRLTAPLRAFARLLRPRRPKTPEASKTFSTELSAQTTPAFAATAVETKARERTPAHAHPRDDAPRLFVEISEVATKQGRTGIQRVVREILRTLLMSPPDGYVVEPICAATQRPYRIVAMDAEGNPHPHAIATDVEFRAGDIFLGLDHSMEAVIGHAAELDEMSRRGVHLYFICNDTLPLSHPDWFPREVPALFRTWLSTIARVGAGILCISRSTEVELLRQLDALGMMREKPLLLGHFHLGADVRAPLAGSSLASDEERNAVEKLQHVPSFLMVGTLEPRKGHAQALEAFELLWSRGEQIALVIIGLPGWMTETLVRRIRHHDELGRRLFWFANADDDLLKRFYGRCTALLAASQGEGFGLPLVEAARQGLPILCRDIPVFREIAGDHATYFSGADPESLATALQEWLKAWSNGRAPGSKEMPWLTWEQSTQQLLDVLLRGRWDESWGGVHGLPPEMRDR